MTLRSTVPTIKYFTIGGDLVPVYTLTNFAKYLKKRPATIRRLHNDNTIPEANFRAPGYTTKNGEKRLGTRLYTVELAQKLKPIFDSGIRRGVKISTETKVKVSQLFHWEKEKYLS